VRLAISVRQMSRTCGDWQRSVTRPKYLIFTPWMWKIYSRD
jgi:hypothetical protein